MENNWFQNPWATNQWMPGGAEFEKWAAPISDLGTDTDEPVDSITEAGNKDSLGFSGEVKLLDSKNKKLELIINQDITYKVISCATNANKAINIMQNYISEINDGLSSTYSFQLESKHKLSHNPETGQQYPEAKAWTVKANIQSSYKVRFAHTCSNISNKDLIIAIVDSLGKQSVKDRGFVGEIEPGGIHEKGGRIMALKKDTCANANKLNIIHLFAHEEGHRLTLIHDHSSSNVMSYTTFTSIYLTNEQKNDIISYFLPIALFKLKQKFGKFTSTFAFTEDSYDAIKDFLENLNNNGKEYTLPKKS